MCGVERHRDMRLTFLARIRDLRDEALQKDLQTNSAHDDDAAGFILGCGKFK